MGLGADFYLHIISVIIISTIFARICLVAGAERLLATCIGTFVGVAVGLAKECYDSKKSGTPSIKDFFADVIGGVLFALVFI